MDTPANPIPAGLFLASQSPRRRELLTQIGVNFEVVKVNVSEAQLEGESARDYVVRLAVEKASAARASLSPAACVLGADTVVVLGEEVLGKPKDALDAQTMLMRLSNRTHTVMTGVALVNAEQTRYNVCMTEVAFRAISKSEAELYWHTGEPVDKAGAYGIQGFGAVFVANISGSYSNVVGLPLFETQNLLSQFGIPVWQG